MLMQRIPAPPLRPFIRTLWVSEPAPMGGDGGALLEHVLPSGEMHLVFRLSGPPLCLLEGHDRASRRTLGYAVVGGARSSFYAKDVSTPTAAIGAQLFPGAAELLFGASSEELAEGHTALENLWGLQARLALEQLQENADLGARLDMLEKLLAARLPAVRALHPAVAQALQGIGQMQRVDALVRDSGYSHRQFVALFKRAVGLPPKVYARVLRFQSLLKQAHGMARLNRPVSWADLALQAGYSDQAHFSREFRAMAGVTPEAYRRQASEHANHLALPALRK